MLKHTSSVDLSLIDPLLLAVMQEAARDQDLLIVCGRRTLEEQKAAIESGASKLKNPNEGKHLKGEAVDVWLPEPDRNRWSAYVKLAELVRDVAQELGARIRWGGSWEFLTPGVSPAKQAEAMAKRVRAQGRSPFVDPAHFEIYHE